jgi:hypothetical protein
MIIKKLSIVLLVSIVCISSTFATEVSPNTSGSVVQKGYNRPSGKRSESESAADKEERKAKRKKMREEREAQGKNTAQDADRSSKRNSTRGANQQQRQSNPAQSAPAVLS